MNEDKMRAEFEAWWREEYDSTLYCESAWRGWQASRAALVVELPTIDISLSSCRTDEWCEGVVHATEKYRDAIEAAGVRVKQ